LLHSQTENRMLVSSV